MIGRRDGAKIAAHCGERAAKRRDPVSFSRGKESGRRLGFEVIRRFSVDVIRRSPQELAVGGERTSGKRVIAVEQSLLKKGGRM